MSLQHGTAAFAASSVLLAGAASGQGGYQLFHNASLVTDSDGEASLLNPLGSDFNGDGVVNLADFSRLQSNFGEEGMGPSVVAKPVVSEMEMLLVQNKDGEGGVEEQG